MKSNGCEGVGFGSRSACMPFASLALIVAILQSCAGASAASLIAVVNSAVEYEVKAVFLLNFARFIEWPPNTFGDPKEPFSICVFGRDPFQGVLEDALLGKSIGERRVVIGHANQMQDLAGCQIVFAGKSEKAHFAELASHLRGRSVLLVGESAGFTESVGVIQFTSDDGRVRFIINPDAADRAGLKISSKLLMLATIVHDPGPVIAGSAPR